MNPAVTTQTPAEEQEEVVKKSRAPDQQQQQLRTKYHAEMVFIGQMLVIFAVVGVALYNLSITSGEPQTLWVALLGSCLGYVLPNPKPKAWRPLFT